MGFIPFYGGPGVTERDEGFEWCDRIVTTLCYIAHMYVILYKFRDDTING
jgi:hypothetical protein